MAMAYRAPDHDRKFHFHITDHALERFRERVDEERRALNDGALALLLDERLWDAHQAKRFTEVVDRDRADQPTWIFEVEARSGRKQFVVMRRYYPGARPAMPTLSGSIGCPLAAITVLTSEMAAANYANGVWRVPDRRVAEKLAAAGITVSAPKGAPSVAVPSADSPPPKVEPKVEDDRDLTDHEDNQIKPRTRGAATGTIVERIQFAKQVLRERPHINALGKDGLREVVRERFNVGMSWETITRLREQVAEEMATAEARGGMISPAAAYPATELSNMPKRLNSITVAASHDREPSVAEQLTLAIAVEKKAKWCLDSAQADLKAATAKVDELMAALRATRE